MKNYAKVAKIGVATISTKIIPVNVMISALITTIVVQTIVIFVGAMMVVIITEYT